MSRKTTPTTGDPLPSGDIRFYDNFEAPLEAGDYIISARQHAQNTQDGIAPNGKPLDQQFPANAPLQQAFTVVAPRFAIDPADVYSVFPPASTSGTYDQNLPHIVLTKRGLPWERYLTEGNKITPWLAVLLFSPEEIIAPPIAPGGNPLANPSRSGTYHLTEIQTPPQGTLGPNFVPESEDQLDKVTGVQLTAGGSGYTSAPQVVFNGGGGSGAAATATVQNGAVVSLTLTDSGSGYTSDPTVSFAGGGGSGATAQVERGLLCTAIDVSTDVFTRVTPRFSSGSNPVDELKYLAHCRQVNTADKEVQTTKDAGWFSVVIGNRFPSPGPGPVVGLTLIETGTKYSSAPAVALSGGGGTGAAGVATIDNDGSIASLTLTSGGSGYTAPPVVSFTGGGGVDATAETQISAPWIAHLVTLEGFEDYLTDAPNWPAGINRVRLVSLYSWHFTCLSETGDFRDLALNLIKGQAAGGEGLLLRLPVSPLQQIPGSPEALVQQTLNEGYSALAYDTAIGDHTFAWYRGPLSPLPRPLFSGINGYDSAAAATIYDQTNGLFDQSYAAAWQMGRLLALADAAFGSKLLQWRRSGTQRTNLLLERLNSPKLKALTNDTPLSSAHLRELLKPDLVSSSMMNRLTKAFTANNASRIAQTTLPTNRAINEAKQSIPKTNHVTSLKTLFAQPHVQDFLAELHQQDLQESDSPLVYIQNWLAELCLLYGVPFTNLIPDARMLPPESLRFFYVDPNYVEALVSGALSIGLQSSRESLWQASARPVLRAAMARALPSIRAKKARRAVAATDFPAPPISTTVAGLLLRSSMVADWPGLEVRGYSDAAGTQPLTLLRMDRLAPDVLLCLFPSAPARVEISEPKEGLAFGHEDDYLVDLRWVTDDHPIGDIIPGKTATINTYFRSAGPGPVLSVKDWQPYLQAQLNAAYGNGNITLGPADFAIQMVRAPEKLVLINTPAFAEETK